MWGLVTCLADQRSCELPGRGIFKTGRQGHHLVQASLLHPLHQLYLGGTDCASAKAEAAKHHVGSLRLARIGPAAAESESRA